MTTHEKLEKLDKATREIFGKSVPWITLVRFINAVELPEIPKLEPIKQRPVKLNPEAWR